MTDAKIIALYDALQISDEIMDVINGKKEYYESGLGNMDLSFHGIETSEEETDETRTVFALLIRVEVKK